MCKATSMFPSFFSNWQFETAGPFSINESDEPKAELKLSLNSIWTAPKLKKLKSKFQIDELEAGCLFWIRRYSRSSLRSR